jgi:hypothetical protein
VLEMCDVKAGFNLFDLIFVILFKHAYRGFFIVYKMISPKDAYVAL